MIERKQITAKELIEVLQKLPPETLVDHFDDVYGNQPVTGWTYPTHDLVKDEEGKAIWKENYKSILLS